MYLPKNKYRIKTTLGAELKDSSGIDYIGSYIELSNGTIYAGSDLDNIEGLLSRVKKINLKNIPQPYNDYYGPTVFDYKNGFFIRYFIRDNRDGKIVEVGLRQFKEKRKLKYVTAGKVEWILKGPGDNKRINGVEFKGAGERNKESIRILGKTLKGIENFVKNYKEFVR